MGTWSPTRYNGREIRGLHWDLWGCECVESDGGEIEEVT